GSPEGERPLKLASNENPLGPSPRALEAAHRALQQSHRYPEGSGRLLRQALSRKWKFPAEQILLGNGSTEIVEMLARAFVGKGAGAVTATPSFIMYRIAVLSANGSCREVPLKNQRFDLPAMAGACDESTSLVYVANPNNPTGTYATKAELEDYFGRVPDSVLTVLDEAYAEYLDQADYPSGADLLRQGRRIIVLRTFSKAYGLAGIRMGYALASREVISVLDRGRSPFNTSRVAQAAALAALEDQEHLQRSRESNRFGLQFLQQALASRGIRFTPSVANFLLVHCEGPAETAYEALLRKGIITRPLAPYGLPNSLRITVGTDRENRRLLAALEQTLQIPGPGAF
ncbi:MAG: histidinol-phosphate transaminase, partial [Acidobacteria bacterium]|nr:histidinol-phosphate transaminase [Acidobacteriota bacterium]